MSRFLAFAMSIVVFCHVAAAALSLTVVRIPMI
jgi:hypothetical protein